MTQRRIHSLTWRPPDDWLSWSLDAVVEARTDAATLADGRTLDALMAAVAEFQTIVTQEVPGTAAAALWVPDPQTREPLATAALRVTSPGPEGRWDLEETLDFARSTVRVPTGVKLLDVAALPTTTPAGDAVIQIVDSRPRFGRRVNREWVWFILPPSTQETLLLQVQCDLVRFFDEVSDLTAEIADTVAVELEPA
ncbi:hypothetical protein [Cellulomonas xiejunii]|uniref:Uncharacterized protein n=1 Tax=Cellulomonas xiejunii TaxID=2968083 RepID=A0ABY5KNY4_9CELL|nr:hypothetical protein [Cellulomonas xiejunii]MCC2314208.1 hypothetical protein [Cellulomonas xiejunii]MCC2319570.1 hypothetical protein [Cellulomonas xiejunii]UUI71484.1 hypothetical protein NP048_17090 [Cellulomonas xiejunii]